MHIKGSKIIGCICGLESVVTHQMMVKYLRCFLCVCVSYFFYTSRSPGRMVGWLDDRLSKKVFGLFVCLFAC